MRITDSHNKTNSARVSLMPAGEDRVMPVTYYILKEQGEFSARCVLN